MQHDIKAHGVSRRGTRRETNEDQFLVADLCKSMIVHETTLDLTSHSRLFGGSQGILLLVADGMGGLDSGEKASTLAVETLNDYVLNYLGWLYQLDAELDDDFTAGLQYAVSRCDAAIQEQASSMPPTKRMGSTLTMAYIVWPRLYVVHAGDSRCYVFRGDTLDQITTDHTLAQHLVDAGTMNPEEAARSRESHVLLNALGGNETRVHSDVHRSLLNAGDTLLLCTDGLTGHLSDDEIRNHLRSAGPAEAVCEALVAHARDAGASDDVTVVVARVPATKQAEREATTRVSVPPQAEAV